MANSRMNKHLKKTELKKLETKIISEIERLENKLTIESQLLQVNGAGDDVDNANNDLMRRHELRFATRESLYLKKLYTAKEHIQTDEYGICDECGAQITFVRLNARPTSTMCISCKEESERDEMQSFRGKVSGSLSQMHA